VRKYWLWSRCARERFDGHSGSSSPALSAQVAPKRAVPDVRARPRPDITTRRRHALQLILGVIAVPALVALATGYSAAWWVFVGMLPVFGIYVAVVFYARRVSAEREINVAFLGSTPGPGAGLEDMFAAATQLDEVGA
jgi:hypothetical protein